jgi:hypothetical protein
MSHARRPRSSDRARASAPAPSPLATRFPERWRDLALQVVLVGIAALLLLWGLGDRYLWQDEAATAVLADRMLRFGRPLAYDGKNLITIDHFALEDARSIDRRTGDPTAAVDYYVARGDLKPDTSWKYHPWGQFVVAAASLAALGHTTLAARLPFALAGVATVLLLYRLVRDVGGDRLMASAAAVVLVTNAYWLLHARQCRYYALSSLLLTLTLLSYVRWQRGARWGPVLFVPSAWAWFQVDYGTLWPILAVLFVDALLADRSRPWRPIAVGLALAAAVAPFVYFYDLWHRAAAPVISWALGFRVTLANINEQVVPAVIVVAAVVVLVWRRDRLSPRECRLITIAVAILLALTFWVATVMPAPFLRYVIVASPVGAWLAAWVFVRAGGPHALPLAGVGAAVLVLTPWLGLPLRPVASSPTSVGDAVVRPELIAAASAIFERTPDPNGLVVEWLKRAAAPTDEILINYEDAPLIFYLPNPIRGGIAAFRVEDDARTPPRFAVLRRSVRFVHWPVFIREMERYRWIPVPLQAPDVAWGNNPDPIALVGPTRASLLYAARRAD